MMDHLSIDTSGEGVMDGLVDQFPAARLKLDELFLHWLSLDETKVTHLATLILPAAPSHAGCRFRRKPGQAAKLHRRH
jgi:hypothetical protein